jgi:transposase InsO family protein
MPWKETDSMNERIKFISAYLGGEDSITDLCSDFGISRKTGYKWIERYEQSGVEALLDRSRAPLTHANAVCDEAITEILKAREKHPRWGPRKLLVLLERRYPNMDLPVASTIGAILRRNGLIKPKKRIRRSSPYGDRLSDYGSPNTVWCADFKGNFPVNGKRCHPLTISDGASRFLLRCKALPRPLCEPSMKVFESAFREYGLPEVIRTDNGAPFSTLAPGGLSTLAIWWIRLGIRPERILPGRPDQNGRHERMHRTLKAETARPPRTSFRAQQRAFDLFREEYNYVRPHEALDQQVPSSLYTPSPRPYPRRIPEIAYPGHFIEARTYPNGVISFRDAQWYISGCLRNEVVGLEEVENDRWKVFFGPIQLGVIDGRRSNSRGNRTFGTLIRTDGEINLRPKMGRPRKIEDPEDLVDMT